MLSISNLGRQPDLGEMPDEDNEVILEGPDDGLTFGLNPEDIIGQTFSLTSDDEYEGEHEVKVAGIVFSDSILGKSEDEISDLDDSGRIYFSDSMITEMRSSLYASNSTVTVSDQMIIGDMKMEGDAMALYKLTDIYQQNWWTPVIP